jgi:hypothetical protein
MFVRLLPLLFWGGLAGLLTFGIVRLFFKRKVAYLIAAYMAFVVFFWLVTRRTYVS